MFNARNKYFWVGIIGSIIWLVAGIAVIAFNCRLARLHLGNTFTSLQPMAFCTVLALLQQGDAG
jgi:hypothetical protein